MNYFKMLIVIFRGQRHPVRYWIEVCRYLYDKSLFQKIELEYLSRLSCERMMNGGWREQPIVPLPSRREAENQKMLDYLRETGYVSI